MNSTIKACQEAAQLLVEIRQKKVPPVPIGWFTSEQFAEHSECSRDIATKRMAELVKADKFVSRDWPKMNSRGTVIKQTIYRKK